MCADSVPIPAEPAAFDPAPFDAARAAIPGFCARHFSFRGTLRLHRAAVGLDLLRAPANVALAPFHVLSRLVIPVLRFGGARRAADWLAVRPLLLRTKVAARVETLVREELLAPITADREVARALGLYGGTRSAVAEITTTLGTLGTGALIFKTVTPGVVSMAPALALSFAQGAAIAAFPLGGAIGSGWYWMFPVSAGPGLTLGLGLGLAALASVVTTFAGLVADPVQRLTGLHGRRLNRLVAALERAAREGRAADFRAREHYIARIGDMADAGLAIGRMFRP